MSTLNFATTDLLTALELCPNENAQGEMLRNIVFNQSNDKYGCYTTFETNLGFQEMDVNWRRQFWRDYSTPTDPFDEEDIEEMATMSAGGGKVVFSDCIVHCGWYWDGDGTLAFIITDLDGDVVHAIINWDCKKNYVWKRE